MGKYLKEFELTSQYEEYINSTVALLPNVSHVKETPKVFYNPIDYTKQYLTFEALEDGTFSFQKQGYGNDIQYSLDNGTTWTPLASGETVSVVTSDKVMWKSGMTSGYSGIGKFSSTNKFNVYGNTMSLLYGDKFIGRTSLEGMDCPFYALFRDNSGLIDASNMILPATILAYSCYREMFTNCTSLTTAPELPGTTLDEDCYTIMFYGCTSLTTAPELPATMLAKECYYGMFWGCTSLTTAPELPATTLATYCYREMFYGCTSLVNAPKLPATTLTELCYLSMFRDCTNLTSAPELPATTLADGCYSNMFYGCTSLTTAPSILPATTLVKSCYYSMFRDCRSMTTAPVLPATTLVEGCYNGIFYYCESLNHITMLATDISANKCLEHWVLGVSSSGTIVKQPDMTTLPRGESGIPVGWTVIDYVA